MSLIYSLLSLNKQIATANKKSTFSFNFIGIPAHRFIPHEKAGVFTLYRRRLLLGTLFKFSKILSTCIPMTQTSTL